jgi:hypothetical protein
MNSWRSSYDEAMEGLLYAYDITHDLHAAIAAGAPGIFRYNAAPK